MPLPPSLTDPPPHSRLREGAEGAPSIAGGPPGLHAQLLNAVEQAVIASDMEGRILLWNPFAERLFGWSAAEALGRSILDLTPVESARSSAEAIMHRIRAGESWSGDFPVRRRDGSELLAQVVLTPFYGPEGLAGMVGVSQDVTQLRRDELALRVQLRRIGLLHELANTLHGTLPLSEIVGRLYEVVPPALDVSRVSLLLYEPEQGALVSDRFLGHARVAGFPESGCQPPGHSVSGLCFQEGRPVLVNDCSRTDLIPPEYVSRLGLRSTVAVPVVDGERVLGVLRLDDCERTGRFTPDDVEYFCLLGRQLGAIIESVMLARERDRAAEALRASEEQFRTLVEQSPLSIQLLAVSGETLQVNPAWERLWGAAFADLAGYNMLEDQQLVETGTMDYLRRAFAGEAVLIPPIAYDRRRTIPDLVPEDDLPERWVRAVAYPIRDARGHVARVVLIHEDYTDRKRLEDQLHDRVDELAGLYRALQATDRRKDEFLATLAHELRNPLAAVGNAVQVMQLSAGDPAAAERSRAVIERQVEHLSRLVTDLLDVSRINSGKLQLHRRVEDLGPLVRATVDSIRPAAEARRHTLTVDIPNDSLFVDVDPTRLDQILANLLSNAIKYTPEGGHVWVTVTRTACPSTIEGGRDRGIERLVSEEETRLSGPIEGERERPLDPSVPLSLHPSISPSLPDERETPTGRETPHPSFSPSSPSEATPACVNISVRDSGVGIARELLPFVFDLFTQGERTLDRSEGGLGIGLTLVRRLVELHDGGIEVRSEGPGQGCEFVIRLPLVQGSAFGVQGSGVGRQSPSTQPVTPTPPHIDTPTHARILVVEDHPDAADTLVDLLELWGYDAAIARTGPAALEKAASFRPAVVLLDIGLPGMDGYEVARRLRDSGQWSVDSGQSDTPTPAHPHTRTPTQPYLVALSGYGSEQDRRRASEAGFDTHLVKPVDPDALRELLERVLAQDEAPSGSGNGPA